MTILLPGLVPGFLHSERRETVLALGEARQRRLLGHGAGLNELGRHDQLTSHGGGGGLVGVHATRLVSDCMNGEDAEAVLVLRQG